MKNEFLLAFNEVLEEKQLPREVIMTALESAMVSAYRREVNAPSAQLIEAKLDPDTGKVSIFVEKEVVEEAIHHDTEISLEEARKIDPNIELDALIMAENTPPDFGRVAAQTARQVIQQRIRDAERGMQLEYYEKQVGEIVSGVVQAINAPGLTIGLEMRAEGLMQRKDMIPGERFRLHERVRALVAEVKDSSRGPQILLSRTHRDFLRRLLENEVPEIYHGVVEIRSIAREPGQRAKVAVFSTAQSGIDPVGACVGVRGVRIQTIVRELHDEKIDVIAWSPDPAVFIAKAVSPARVVGVYLNEDDSGGKTATVVVPEDQLSLAIGRDGQNARLAAKLTQWRIDIKSLTEAAADSLHKLQTDPGYAEQAEAEHDFMEVLEGMLTKKTEGRVLQPEEYDQMARFVDRIEKRRLAAMAAPETHVEQDLLSGVRESLVEGTFEQNLLDSSLAAHVVTLLTEAGYQTVGDLAVKMSVDPDAIFGIAGIGPKAMAEIKRFLDSVKIPETPVGEAVEIGAPVETTSEMAPAEISETLVEVEPLEQSAEEVVEPVTPAEVEGEGEEPSLDTLFALKPEMFQKVESEDEEEEEKTGGAIGDKKKKKKKKGFTKVEYDPDRDVMVVKKQHKRGEDGWEWEE